MPCLVLRNCKTKTLQIKRLKKFLSVFYSEKSKLAGLARMGEEVGISAHTNTKGEMVTSKRTKLGWFMTRGKQECEDTSQA